jgi:hypothetical protein
MSMIRTLGKGYYALEPTKDAVSAAVLDEMDEAYNDAIAIPDDEIKVIDYVYPEKTKVP